MSACCRLQSASTLLVPVVENTAHSFARPSDLEFYQQTPLSPAFPSLSPVMKMSSLTFRKKYFQKKNFSEEKYFLQKKNNSYCLVLKPTPFPIKPCTDHSNAMGICSATAKLQSCRFSGGNSGPVS